MSDVIPRLLAVDDEPAMVLLLRRFGEELGFQVQVRNGGVEALALLTEFRPHVVVVDLQMPDVGGLDVLRAVREHDPECKVILITANPTVETAIEAIKLGALDYVGKPLTFERMRELLTTVKEGLRRRERLLDAEAAVAERFEFYGMTGRSPAMQQLFDEIRRLAPHVRTVLITGETGTGKELVAKALHALGPRRGKRFVTVNCSAVVENLFESELFGHVRGAFTGATDHKVGLFEHASGGTLFLDEAGELPLALQAKLLRAVEYGEVQRVGSLESRRVDVHLIAATNRNLEADVAAGRFRADLYYRLGTIDITIVPLRERRVDIGYLTAHLIKEISGRLNRQIAGVSSAAERLLQDAPWPGNVRQLRNVLERACIMSQTEILTERHFSAILHRPAAVTAASPPSPAVAEPDADRDRLSTMQKEQIQRVLQEVRGNKSEAARVLGVSRRSVYRWIDRFNLES